MDHQEIEWQYDAPRGLRKVEEWLDGHDPEGSGLAILRGSSKQLTDTYYDTEGWWLYRAGYALRIRWEASGKGTEVTMKSIASGAGNLHRRREISESLAGDGLDALQKARGPVGIRLKALAGPRKMRPIFEVRTRRRTFELLLDGQPTDSEKARVGGSANVVRVGEVALDDSEVPLGDGSTHLARVEVEVNASAGIVPPQLEDFVKEMEAALGLRPVVISKYEAGLFATGQDPKDGEGAGDKGLEKE